MTQCMRTRLPELGYRNPLQIWKLKLLPLHSSRRQHDLLLPLEWLAREGADGISVPLVGHPVPLVGRVCWWTEGAASVCHAIAVSGWEAALKEGEEEKGGRNGNQTTKILYNDLAKQICQTMCLLCGAVIPPLLSCMNLKYLEFSFVFFSQVLFLANIKVSSFWSLMIWCCTILLASTSGKLSHLQVKKKIEQLSCIHCLFSSYLLRCLVNILEIGESKSQTYLVWFCILMDRENGPFPGV